MNQKKKKIIIISSGIAVVCVILIILLILVFTGTFKSNKDKFFQYAGKLMNFEDGFIESSISNYFNKLQEKPYNTNGTFNVNVEEGSSENTDDLNNASITFSGKVDTPNNKAEQSISLNYSEDVSFPFMYRQIGNIIALQTDSVSKRFVGIDTENLDELTDKLQESDISMPTSYEFSLNNLDTSEFDLSEEELLRLQHIYIEPIINSFENDKFETVKENNMEGYKVRLSGEDLKNISIIFLQSLKDDQQTLDKLNDTIFSANKLTQSTIEQLIQQTQNETVDESFYVEIAVYGSKGNLNKLQIQNNSFKLELQKNLNGNGVQYNITFTGLDNGNEVAKFFVNASYTGIQMAENVTENYEIGMELPVYGGLTKSLRETEEIDDTFEEDELDIDSEEDSSVEPKKLEESTQANTEDSQKIKFVYNFVNEVEFVDSVEIEDLTEGENCLILNNYSANSVTKFLQSVVERVSKVNGEKLIESGIDPNQFIYMFPGTALLYSNGLNSQANNTVSGVSSSMSEEAISAFNTRFEMYEGSNIKGPTVKGLLSTIQSNNSLDSSYKIEEINFKGEEFEANEQNIATIKDEIQTSTVFKVEFEKNEQGIIYRVVINEKDGGEDASGVTTENTTN